MRRVVRRVRNGRRWVSDHPFRVDVLVALVLALLAVLASAALGAAAFLVSVMQVLPLALRRRSPLVATVAVALGCLVQVAVVDTPLPSNFAVLVVAYSAAAYAPRRSHTLAVLALGWVGAAIAAVDWSRVPMSVDAVAAYVASGVPLGLSFTAAWVLGDVVRRRKLVIANLREQNEALARDQAQRAQLAAQGERAAIAREMHDIVAHSLSVVVVQADGGAYAARTALSRGTGRDQDQAALERAATTLETLAQTARTALADTRTLVGVLREQGSAAEYAPQQGLGHLEEMVQRVRHSGVEVGLSVRGGLDELSPEADLAAYRVVQESLTNVMKHAGPGASAQVEVSRTPAALLVRVTDDGRGPTEHDGRGNGIVGMTERVEVLGGTLYAGPRPAGGFEVVASIPVRQAAAQAGTGPQLQQVGGGGVGGDR